jgi:TPR repeat protein
MKRLLALGIVALIGCAHKAGPPPVEAVKADEPPVANDFAGNVTLCAKDVAASCYAVGQAYSTGAFENETVEKDRVKSAEAFAKACAAKHAEACHMSGHALFEGWAGEPNAEAGLATLGTACELGSGDACYDVAQTQWDNGDYTNGIAGLERACELTSSKGCAALGFYYVRNSVPDKTRALQAVTVLDKACARGDGPSCAAVGTMYEKGEPMANLERNTTRAVESYERACQLNGMYGCVELAKLYQDGVGDVPADFERATELYTTACDAENPVGCMWLAELTRDKDPQRADTAHTRACSVAPQFCVDVGDVYAKKDKRKASEFYTRGCDADDSDACEKLAGVTRDTKAAKALYAKACKLKPENKNACKRGK